MVSYPVIAYRRLQVHSLLTELLPSSSSKAHSYTDTHPHLFNNMSTSTSPSPSTSTTPSLHIDIVSDSVCPWCYIGKRRLEQALKQLSPTVKISKKFQPFFLDPTAPVGQSVNKLQRYYLKFGGKARVDSMIKNMKATGQQLGINFSYGGNTGNTLQSHRLIEYAEHHGKQDDVVN